MTSHPTKRTRSRLMQILRTFLILSLLSLVRPTSAFATDSSLEAASKLQVEAMRILEAHCLRCHGPDKAESHLRLDQNDSIKKHGRAGNPILGPEDESELLRRVSSKDPRYRMPKDESSLPESEIELLREWIRAGAGFPISDTSNEAAKRPAVLKTPELSFWEKHSSKFDQIEAFSQPIRVLLVPALIFLTVALVSERRKRALAKASVESSSRSLVDQFLVRLGWQHYVVVALGFTMLGRLLQNREKIDQLETNLQHVRQELKEFKGEDSFRKEDDKFKVYRPSHPPRLGGMYYRGNDERDSGLFNGGYYRTASMEVGLFDSQEKQLHWGDKPSSNELFIRLDIKRAAFATLELFSDKTMESCFLSPNGELDEESHLAKSKGADPSSRAPFSKFVTVVPNEHWRAIYQIVGPNEKIEEDDPGMLYIIPGSPPPHYGIAYRIKFVNGVISEESEIWMGASYLTGMVVLPKKDTITLSEWFDFLPIPEITGGNTKDPKLLGIKPEEPFD
jgi:Planctomycete cytochrome C